MSHPATPTTPDPAPSTGSGAPVQPSPHQPVQADNLLSQPVSDEQGHGPVGEEISLDQQSDQARRVGHAPTGPGTEVAVADALRPAPP